MSALVSLLFVLLAAVLGGESASGMAAGGKSLSYRNLSRDDLAREFYREAASGWEGKLVHLHVPAKRVLGTPTRIVPNPRGGKLYVFENQSVPLVVDSGSIYYRKILDRVTLTERVCVKGVVKKEPAGGKDRLALWIHTLKRGHDAPKSKKKSSSKTWKPKVATAEQARPR